MSFFISTFIILLLAFCSLSTTAAANSSQHLHQNQTSFDSNSTEFKSNDDIFEFNLCCPCNSSSLFCSKLDVTKIDKYCAAVISSGRCLADKDHGYASTTKGDAFKINIQYYPDVGIVNVYRVNKYIEPTYALLIVAVIIFIIASAAVYYCYPIFMPSDDDEEEEATVIVIPTNDQEEEEATEEEAQPEMAVAIPESDEKSEEAPRQPARQVYRTLSSDEIILFSRPIRDMFNMLEMMIDQAKLCHDMQDEHTIEECQVINDPAVTYFVSHYAFVVHYCKYFKLDGMDKFSIPLLLAIATDRNLPEHARRRSLVEMMAKAVGLRKYFTTTEALFLPFPTNAIFCSFFFNDALSRGAKKLRKFPKKKKNVRR